MLAMPVSQIGWRASRNTSKRSNFAPWLALLAPRRWHTDDVAVHRLAATANRIALSIWPSRRPLLLQQRDPRLPFRSDAELTPLHPLPVAAPAAQPAVPIIARRNDNGMGCCTLAP